MKLKFIDFYMDVAHRVAKLSSAVRLQVGCIVVKDDRILSYGYNGTPAGWDNTCEHTEWIPEGGNTVDYPLRAYYPEYDGYGGYRNYRLTTKPEVIHAERNCIDKLARSHDSGDGATMFLTHSPCVECAKSIYTSGIKHVYYREAYRNSGGLEFLDKCGVESTQVTVHG
jgi:dCMP deaminase